MRQMFTVFKYEFLRYFNTPVAFVYLMAFLLLNASCAFYLGNLLEVGNANLLPMFFYVPWLFLFFIPAITMRLWSDEYKSNTVFQTLSLPVSITSFNIGKFFAAWAFCGLGLILTFIFWITLNVIANPDNSMIFSAYFAAFLLSGVMVAISLFASSVTKNQVIALILGICLILFFFLSGLDFVLGFYKMFLSTSVVDVLAFFSVLSHYSLMLYGLIELKAVLFFVSLIILFNFLSIIAVKAKFDVKRNYKSLVFLAFMFFIGLNLLFSNLLFFVDKTQDKKHSLSFSTKQVLTNLSEPVDVKLYYSQVLSDNNVEFRELFNSVKTLLKQYQRIGGDKFNLEIIHPQSLSQEEDLAIANGLKGLPILDSNQNAFFGLVVTDAIDNKQVVDIFTPQKQGILESIITQKIYLLNHKKINLGVIADVEMFENVVGGVATQNWQIVDELSQFYNIKKINNKSPKIEDVSALMIVSPKNMSEELIKNVREYKNNGGKFFIALDPSPEAVRIFAPQTAVLEASDFNALEQEFGFKFLHQVFVADLDNSLTVDATIDYNQNTIITQDVAQILLSEKQLNQDVTPTIGLKNVLLSSASIFALEKSDKLEITPLIWASKNSQLMSSEYLYKNVNPATILANFKKDNYKKILAAKIVERISPTPFEAIVVGDSDFMYDSYLGATDNLYFVLNALDDLMGNYNLLSLRAKSDKAYKLDKIEALRKQAQLEYAIDEAKLLEDINKTKLKIQEVVSKKHFEERENFVADELAMLAKLRKKLDESKNKLGLLKQNSYKNLKSFNNMLKVLNIYLLPLIILLILLLKMRKNISCKQKTKFVCSKRLVVLTLCSVVVFALGVLSQLSFKKDIINQNVFDNFNIAKINKVMVSKGKQTLELYKDNGVWQIKGHEGFKVYEKRMQNLLTAISFASYYEKKSQKIENLGYFGLSDEGKTHIEIFDADNKVANFYIGKYDIDLGRGSRGAYYKEEDNFDVWLIKADLIDISPNWREFSYSLLWNLRFGKAVGYEAEDIKDLINTPLLSAHAKIKNLAKEFSLDIKTDIKQIVIDFYRFKDKYFAKYNFDNMYYEISKEDFDKLHKKEFDKKIEK